jgi:hypothetical protein
MIRKSRFKLLWRYPVRTSRHVFVAIAGLLLATQPVLAHHSFKAQYDETQPITLKGTITKITWNNPHVLMYLDVKDDKGQVANWQLELASPNGLMSQGWKVDSLKPGEQVSVSGFRARDGSNMANIRKVTMDSR